MLFKRNSGRSPLKRLLVSLLCVLLAGSLFGCSEGEVLNGNLVIELDGNPTTGYTWVYDMSSTGIIEEVSNSYTPVTASDLIVGSGGTFRFEFKAVAPGEVGLQFSYLRTFQENSTISTKTYAVTVDENLVITFYEVDSADSEETDTDNNKIAGSSYIDTVVFGETTEDVVFTWTLCNSGFYIGIDTAYLQWTCVDGVDYISPIYTTGEEVVYGTSMTARRYNDSSLNAEGYAKALAEGESIFTDFTEFSAEIDGLPAFCVYASNPDMGISANYYFVDTANDVVEIAIFYEGSDADNLGPRLDTMLTSISFNDNAGMFENTEK